MPEGVSTVDDHLASSLRPPMPRSTIDDAGIVRSRMTDRPPLPTFIIIGAQKSATRWFRHNLGLHPKIFTAPREVKYFNHPKRCRLLGPGWYREQFEGWAGEPIVGEATPGYMILRHGPAAVAERIDETLAGVRLLALLRNPVDRAHSALLHHVRQERVRPGTRLLDHVRTRPPEDDWLAVVTGGWYAASLQPYLERFGERLLVLLHDDVRADPAGIYRAALEHVGATRDVVPTELDVMVNSNQDGAALLVPPLSAEERAELFEYFADDVARLEKLLGRDLSRWRPAADQAGAVAAGGGAS
jgi:hypothetical protein